jgi:L-lactate dehydrogenase complex protein LldG
MSKPTILAAIRQHKPAEVPLPEPPSFPTQDADLIAQFCRALEAVGGKVLPLDGGALTAELVAQHFPAEARIASTLPGLAGTIDWSAIQSPSDLEGIDLAILPAQFGVAENGALWLTEADCGGWRVLPFIAQHLLLVVPKDNLVVNMHEAYTRIRIAEAGFGCFISGPSKTADIEQALVIGAQGARSLTVML